MTFTSARKARICGKKKKQTTGSKCRHVSHKEAPPDFMNKTSRRVCGDESRVLQHCNEQLLFLCHQDLCLSQARAT
eukprot:893816-Pleurochrysis_carterae.AAC.2